MCACQPCLQRSFDPGFQPFDGLTNLEKLAITMPMSLANTQSLENCKQLRELHLITLPGVQMRAGSLQQVSYIAGRGGGEQRLGVYLEPHLGKVSTPGSHLMSAGGGTDEF
jgi:hypothetical protein